MSITRHRTSEDLAELLHATAIRLLRTVRRVDDSDGATGPRLSALSVIVCSGGITLGDLARAEQVRPPTMTRIVHALEEQQLVSKTKDPEDARSIRITATTKGKRLLLRGRARRIQFLRKRIEALPKLEQETLSAALPILRQLMERR